MPAPMTDSGPRTAFPLTPFGAKAAGGKKPAQAREASVTTRDRIASAY